MRNASSAAVHKRRLWWGRPTMWRPRCALVEPAAATVSCATAASLISWELAPATRCTQTLANESATYAVDLWALGCILFHMLTGQPPFKAASEYLTFQRISDGSFLVPDGMSAAGEDLVRRLLVRDPSSRLGTPAWPHLIPLLPLAPSRCRLMGTPCIYAQGRQAWISSSITNFLRVSTGTMCGAARHPRLSPWAPRTQVKRKAWTGNCRRWLLPLCAFDQILLPQLFKRDPSDAALARLFCELERQASEPPPAANAAGPETPTRAVPVADAAAPNETPVTTAGAPGDQKRCINPGRPRRGGHHAPPAKRLVFGKRSVLCLQ